MPSNQVIRVRRAEPGRPAAAAAAGAGAAGGTEGVAADALRAGVRALQAELGVPADFPPEVQAAAEAAASQVRLPDLDRTDLPFVTIDPEGARDLDQAVHLERADGGGYTVHYAIADVAAFVEAGGPIDVEARRRGESLYGADSKIPLHPPVLSEGAASLLPEQVCPALLWTIRLDADARQTSVHVERARVRSREQLSYVEAQRRIDEGEQEGPGAGTLALLGEIGQKRLALEAERGGVSLPLPDQEIEIHGDRWDLTYRSLLPVEGWNAQISLLTGMSAASLMIAGKVGVLRTLPPADPRDVTRLHRTARALGIDWPESESYSDFIRRLDPSRPRHAAMVVACTALLRGSGYLTFDGSLPAAADELRHSAIAAEYAHVTAPLRRLVDRFGGEICVALCAGTPVPDWVLEALPELPELMRESGRRSGAYERGILDLVEAGLLVDRVGETFAGVVTDRDERNPRKGVVTIAEPAVGAPVVAEQDLPLGDEVTVRLVSADITQRKVRFELA